MEAPRTALSPAPILERASGSEPVAGISPTPDIELRRRFPPITCTACRVTYITDVGSRAPARATGWVCPRCRDEPRVEAHGGTGEPGATGRPPG